MGDENIGRWVVIGNERYGLYYGRIVATDGDIAATRSIRCYDCRHISRYNTVPGGITSLAKHGPLPGKEQRIGAACDALLTGVVNVFDVSAEARGRFDAVSP